ncbi:hypothetical protein B0O80DRAFT_443184 [Mortierella sp. GBAus27b]|nr:hypothetical protein B0O80DRAFT_443184 [Mortierella sp. GBAus27b]
MDEEETTVDHTARWMGYESMVPTQLRLLDVFLRRGDDEQFGNLFRTVNAEGYVRWVCVDHFRGIHHEKEAEALRATLKSLGRSFDENVGRVEVMLCSREEANQFYQGLERVVSVYELEIQLYWDVTPDDLKRLRDTLAKTNVSMLNLEIDVHDDSTTDSSKDTSDGAQLCGAILDLMRHATIQSFTMIEVPKEFFENISLLSHHADLSNLKVLDIGQELYEVDQGLYDTDPEAWDSPGLKKLLSKATNLSSLTLREAEDDTPQIYSAIAKYQTYPIYLQDRLRILPPTDEGRCRCGQPMDTIEDMEDLLKGYGGRIEMLDMYYKEDLDESTLKAFAKSISRGSCLEDLRLAEIDPSVWESCGTHLANIVSRSKLRKLVARFGGGGEAGLQLLESIQWDHIRTLGIRMDQVSLGAMAMELLLDGIGSRSGRVALQDFRLFSDCTKQVSDQLLGLLQSFLGSMPPLMDLDLGVTLTLDQICTLLKSTDLSEVLYLGVRAKDFDETKVGVILDTLEHATQLRKVSLYGAKRAENQSKRLSAKGILLSDQ